MDNMTVNLEQQESRIRWSTYFYGYALPVLALLSVLVGIILLINQYIVISLNGTMIVMIHNGKGFGLIVILFYTGPLLITYFSWRSRKIKINLSVDDKLKLEKKYRGHCLGFGVITLGPLILLAVKKGFARKK